MISTHITLELSSYTYTGLNFPARFYGAIEGRKPMGSFLRLKQHRSNLLQLVTVQ